MPASAPRALDVDLRAFGVDSECPQVPASAPRALDVDLRALDVGLRAFGIDSCDVHSEIHY